jgi:hypothetical protein
MQFIRFIIDWFRGLRLRGRRSRTDVELMFLSVPMPIHREVTAQGIRVFSLCGSCGTRLEASATLCDDCAQRKSRPIWPS